MDQAGLEWKKVDMAERMTLDYFNSYLYEKGVISEHERNRMAIEIKNRRKPGDDPKVMER